MVMLLVEPDNPEYICLPENGKMDETSLSTEEQGITLEPIDISGQTHLCFCFCFKDLFIYLRAGGGGRD